MSRKASCLRKVFCLRNVSLAGFLAALSCGVAQAQNYQFEVNGGLGFLTDDFGAVEADADLLGIAGTVYFETVRTRGGPLAEAAFIQHASNASLELVSKNYDDGFEDEDTQSIEARVHANSGVFLNLRAFQNDDGNNDSSAFGFGVGYHLTDLSTIEGNLLSVNADNNVDINVYSAAYRQLMMQQSPYTIAFNVDLAFQESDAVDGDGVGFGAGLTLYPSDFLGLSVGFEHFDADTYSQKDLVLSADYFVQSNFRIGVEYLTGSQDADNSNFEVDTDLLAFNAGVRF